MPVLRLIAPDAAPMMLTWERIGMTANHRTDFNTPSGWNRMLPARPPAPKLSGTHRAKYAIVGAGYTGTAAARRLVELDPAADIVLIDAGVAGEGSSGRNSGFTRPFEFPIEISEGNAEQVARVTPYNEEGFSYLKQAIDTFGIDCGLTRAGVIRGAATVEGEKRIIGSQRFLDAMKIKNVMLSRREMEERTGTAYYRQGLYLEDSYFVQPAALIRGLVDNLPSAVALFEQSPVARMRKDGHWTLESENGRVVAETVVLAVNGFAGRLGYLKDRIVAMYTYAAISEPVPVDMIGGLGSMPTWGILPAHKMGTTCRRVGADRVMVRSLASYESEMPTRKVEDGLRKIRDARWPHLSHLKFEFVWGGATGFTMNGAPWAGRLEDGLYAAGGCNGAGISKGTLLGKRLAELITHAGDHDAFIRDVGEASRMIPEPFRRIGYEYLSRKAIKEASLEA